MWRTISASITITYGGIKTSNLVFTFIENNFLSTGKKKTKKNSPDKVMYLKNNSGFKEKKAKSKLFV